MHLHQLVTASLSSKRPPILDESEFFFAAKSRQPRDRTRRLHGMRGQADRRISTERILTEYSSLLADGSIAARDFRRFPVDARRPARARVVPPSGQMERLHHNVRRRPRNSSIWKAANASLLARL